MTTRARKILERYDPESPNIYQRGSNPVPPYIITVSNSSNPPAYFSNATGDLISDREQAYEFGDFKDACASGQAWFNSHSSAFVEIIAMDGTRVSIGS